MQYVFVIIYYTVHSIIVKIYKSQSVVQQMFIRNYTFCVICLI